MRTECARTVHASRRETGRCAAWVVALSMLALPGPGVGAGAQDAAAPPSARPAGDDACVWCTVSIDVDGLPADSGPMPVSCPVDLTALLDQCQVRGLPDTQRLRMVRLAPDGTEADEPVQFTPVPQSGPAPRRLLPGTSPDVSYSSETPASDMPPGIRVAGDLCWMVRGDAQGRSRHRLEIGVPRVGASVQVPYPPRDFRTFDSRHRAAPARWFAGMQIRPQQPLGGAVHVFDEERLVTTWHTGPTTRDVAQGMVTLRRPFLHPLNGPEGVSLTGFGKPHDPTGSHAHHYSFWIAHAKVDGLDFWSERGGLLLHERFDDLQDGAVFCRVIQSVAWVADPGGGTPLVRERRQMTFYRAAAEHRVIDVEIALAPAGHAPVTFGRTSFGFLSVRTAQSIAPFDGGGEILNSEGARNEQEAHLKRARWLDLSGPVTRDQWNGITLMDAPDNPNHPTGWHLRNDGWACASFNLDAPFALAPGATLRLRYRVLLHRHDAARAGVARRYGEFAARPRVRLGEPRSAPRKMDSAGDKR